MATDKMYHTTEYGRFYIEHIRTQIEEGKVNETIVAMLYNDSNETIPVSQWSQSALKSLQDFSRLKFGASVFFIKDTARTVRSDITYTTKLSPKSVPSFSNKSELNADIQALTEFIKQHNISASAVEIVAYRMTHAI